MEETMITPATLEDGNVVVWFEDVNPSRAKVLLDTYEVDYRKYRPTYGEGLARDMASGNWNFDGSPIRIDEENNLFDGQHRLNAVMMSSTTQRFMFVGGLPKQAYNTTDTGLARTYGDTLRRRGYNNVTMRTALIKLIARWERGVSLGDTSRMTNSELDEVGDRYIDSINRAVQMASGLTKKSPLPSALIAFSWWILSRCDNEKAYEFLISVFEGEMIRRGMPAYTLKTRLENDAEVFHTRNEFMHLVFQAWNAFYAGQELNRLNLPKGQTTRENMVNPSGLA